MRELLVETSPAKHSNRNDGPASAKDRNHGDCPDGIAKKRRSDRHNHSYDEHDRNWNDVN
jgi:hypothetical protein